MTATQAAAAADTILNFRAKGECCSVVISLYTTMMIMMMIVMCEAMMMTLDKLSVYYSGFNPTHMQIIYANLIVLTICIFNCLTNVFSEYV